MTTKFLADGDILNHVASQARSAGEVVQIGDRIGVCITDIANGATGALAIEGVFLIAKTAAEAYAQGAQLYWDNTNFKVTSTVGSNKKAGFAAAAALSADATCAVNINM